MPPASPSKHCLGSGESSLKTMLILSPFAPCARICFFKRDRKIVGKGDRIHPEGHRKGVCFGMFGGNLEQIEACKRESCVRTSAETGGTQRAGDASPGRPCGPLGPPPPGGSSPLRGMCGGGACVPRSSVHCFQQAPRKQLMAHWGACVARQGAGPGPPKRARVGTSPHEDVLGALDRWAESVRASSKIMDGCAVGARSRERERERERDRERERERERRGRGGACPRTHGARTH